LDLEPEYLVKLDDAVIAVKQPNGRVKLNQLFHPAAAGAAYGALWVILMDGGIVHADGPYLIYGG
jgi:uncharacterized membrane protein